MAVSQDTHELRLDSPTISDKKSTWRNVLRFTLTRFTTLVVTVTIAIFLTIVIANYGGYVDTIIASRIEEQVGFSMRNGLFSDLPPDERITAAEELIAAMQDAAGLNDPFLLRSLRWLGDGLTLNWGGPGRAQTVRDVIVDNLARTLLVFGAANLLLFVAAVLLALALSRRYGGKLDRLFVLLSPISAAPAWVYGVLLSVFLLRFFGFSPGGTFESFPDEMRLSSVVVMLRHLVLPFAAVFLAGLFQSVYTWRNYFQIYSDEDYVEMAYARGLSNGRIDRHYIMRPALPALLTSFALLLAVLWQEIIALEYFFNVRGIGRLFINALTFHDTRMIVAIVTVFAYLLAITVFILDIFYLFVDPRVRAGAQDQQERRIPKSKRQAVLRSLRRLPHLSLATLKLPRFSFSLPQFSMVATAARRASNGTIELLRALRRYPAALFGLIVIAFLLGVSVYTITTIPYQEAILLWRGDNNVWTRNPRNALPTWVNLFRVQDLPPTLTINAADVEDSITITALDGGLTDVSIPFSFDYNYSEVPQEIVVDITARYAERGPHVSINWVWEDGSERELTSMQPRSRESYFVSRDARLQRRLRSEQPQEVLFLGPEGDATRPIPGTYTLRIDALHFEPESEIDVEVTILGQVYGLAGTDSQRRDMMIAVLWGTPIALAFGLIAAFATSVGGMLIAALGAWYSGIVDRIVQFLTEVNLILPFFPVSLMVFALYSRSIVTILAVTVALTIFGSAVKTYRATFLQVRSAPYIEAAQAYGASNWRIVVRYMIPRIVTVLVPRLIILVPSYVFLEATLAFLGITDPYLPTWGKLVVSALSYGVHVNAAHLVIAPLGLLFITGFSFAMVGLALERIFEPKLQQM